MKPWKGDRNARGAPSPCMTRPTGGLTFGFFNGGCPFRYTRSLIPMYPEEIGTCSPDVYRDVPHRDGSFVFFLPPLRGWKSERASFFPRACPDPDWHRNRDRPGLPSVALPGFSVASSGRVCCAYHFRTTIGVRASVRRRGMRSIPYILRTTRDRRLTLQCEIVILQKDW